MSPLRRLLVPESRSIRLFAAGLALAILAVLAAVTPGLHPRREMRRLVDRVSDQLDVPGIRDCQGLLTRQRECRTRGD